MAAHELYKAARRDAVVRLYPNHRDHQRLAIRRRLVVFQGSSNLRKAIAACGLRRVATSLRVISAVQRLWPGTP